MKHSIWMIGALIFSLQGAIAEPLEVGQEVPNLCYQNVDENQSCLENFQDTIRVLIFNAGY